MHAPPPVRRPLRTLAASLGAVALIGTAGCATSTDRTEPAEPPVAEQQAAQQTEHGHHHKFKGPARYLLDAALEHGDLTADQEDIVFEIAADLEMDEESKERLKTKFKASVVEVVRAGTADSEQFEKTVDEATKVLEERMLASGDALKELHALLEDDQRALVADVMRERMAERWGKPHPEHKKKRPKRVKQVISYLMLSTYQVDKLKELRNELFGKPKHLRPTREELTRLNDSFEADDFDQVLDEFQTAKIDLIREHIASAGENTDTILSIFTDAQRALLADLIDRGPREIFLGEEEQAEQE